MTWFLLDFFEKYGKDQIEAGRMLKAFPVKNSPLEKFQQKRLFWENNNLYFYGTQKET